MKCHRHFSRREVSIRQPFRFVPTLKWTDGTPFTANDVAFTVNTALAFQLGFDWHDFYNPDFIDHVEAVDALTVKFYFRQQPNVGVWQYGALQGPIVQQAYWSSKVSASAALLPPSTLLPQIASLTAQVADMQSKINTVNANIAILSTTSSGYIQGIADIKGLQANLNQTNTALAKAQSQYDSAMDAARQSLYALDNQDEPRLGIWQLKSNQSGMIENDVNAQFPFENPSFDRTVYQLYPTEDAALVDLENGKVELLLEQNGLSAQARNELGSSASILGSPTLWLHFLVFNVSNLALGGSALHQALACIFDAKTMAGQWGDAVAPLTSFVVPDEKFWIDANVALPCNGLDLSSRLSQAIEILKTAGYTWKILPSQKANGQGFTLPNGEAFPAINLIVSSSDEQEISPSHYILQQLSLLGVPLTIELINPEDLRYAVFSSHQYDMAILGWNVSEYPGYLCDWFKDGNPFGYQSDRLRSVCKALNSTGDLSAAQKDVYEILIHPCARPSVYSVVFGYHIRRVSKYQVSVR